MQRTIDRAPSHARAVVLIAIALAGLIVLTEIGLFLAGTAYGLLGSVLLPIVLKDCCAFVAWLARRAAPARPHLPSTR